MPNSILPVKLELLGGLAVELLELNRYERFESGPVFRVTFGIASGPLPGRPHSGQISGVARRSYPQAGHICDDLSRPNQGEKRK